MTYAGAAAKFCNKRAHMTKPIVIIESPYAGDVEENVEYAKRCVKDSLDRGEAPFASHLLYTQVLDDTKPEERKLGMEAGFAIGAKADLVAVYVDRGMSPGMVEGFNRARARGQRTEFRSILAQPIWWFPEMWLSNGLSRP